MLKRLALSTAVLLPFAFVGTIDSADAGSTGAQPDAKIAKRKNGPYKGGGIVNDYDVDVVRNLAPGDKGVYWLKVKNVGTAAGDVVLIGSDDTPDLDFKWLRGKNDVTD